MDLYFSKSQKNEREFQQLVVRENTMSSISNQTDYFICDIELSISDARFDMLAFKWPGVGSKRKIGEGQLSLIEMKYGDNALSGNSGIIKHFNDMKGFLQNHRMTFAIAAEEQINQLNSLGLIRHTRGTERKFSVDCNSFELIFIFANHNPRSKILLEQLEKLKDVLENGEIHQLKFVVASTAGYAMYESCMMNIDEYMNFVKSQQC